MNPMPINPDIVRQEVQVLKSDFNGRLKQVLFNAMVCRSLLDNAPEYLVGCVSKSELCLNQFNYDPSSVISLKG